MQYELIGVEVYVYALSLFNLKYYADVIMN